MTKTFRLKDDTKVLALALPIFCVGHSAAVLTCLEHNHKRWLPVVRAFVLQTSCNDCFRSCALAWSTTVDGGCRSMFALVKSDLRACTRLLSVAAAARSSPLLLLAARRCCWIWMLMEPALHLDPATRRWPHAAAAAATACHCCCTPLRCCLPCCASCYSRCVHQAAAALGACQNCAAHYLNFRPTPEEPASGRGERRKTLREA